MNINKEILKKISIIYNNNNNKINGWEAELNIFENPAIPNKALKKDQIYFDRLYERLKLSLSYIHQVHFESSTIWTDGQMDEGCAVGQLEK